jgi:hypothetical protein
VSSVGQVKIGAPTLDPMEPSMEPSDPKRLLVATTATHMPVPTKRIDAVTGKDRVPAALGRARR